MPTGRLRNSQDDDETSVSGPQTNIESSDAGISSANVPDAAATSNTMVTPTGSCTDTMQILPADHIKGKLSDVADMQKVAGELQQ